MNDKTTLTFGRKLFLSNALYVIPVLVLMFLLNTAKMKDVEFAQLEIKGARYQKPLEGLLEAISLHRLATRRLIKGLPGPELAVLAAAVDSKFDELKAADKKMGEALQFTDDGLGKRSRENLKLDRVLERWEGQRSKASTLGLEESENLHIALIADIRGMIAHAGDTSNLILDPDLDSYYLMDATLLALPQLQDRLQEISAYTEAILERGQPTPEEAIKLAVYSELLKQSDLDRIVADIDTVLKEDQNFYGVRSSLQSSLPVVKEELIDSVGRIITLLKDIAQGKATGLASTVFAGEAEAAMKDSYEAWQTAIVELEGLLESRIESIEQQRIIALCLGILALVFASIISFFVLRGVK